MGEVKQAELTPADFVHLHNHTHYSLLDGLTKIDDLVDWVKELGMKAVAVTDHGTMSGLIDLYKTATAAGIKPILGFEAYVAARGRADKDPAKDKERFHVTLLAMNDVGLKNLMWLSTEANLNGFYYKPRIDHEILETHAEGVICLSGCAGSEVSMRLIDGDYKGAVELAKWYRSVFGDRYYLEMQDHGHPDSPTHWVDQKKVNEGLAKMSKELDIPLVVTCDGHYLKKEDQDAHEILLCVGTGSNLSDSDRMSMKDFELHVISPKDIIKRWGKDFPEAVRNTKRIADRCTLELEFGRMLIPKFPLPEGEKNEKEFIDKLVYRGLAWRYGGKTEEEASGLTVEEAKKTLSEVVLERAAFELGTVDRMNFNGYFLIVQDFINWGKRQGIIFGPGRGSGAGSIMAYALRITELEPLRYGLLFERFLNPDRISMPDFDVDIQDTRRDEVVKYCTDKYGDPRVANICTFGKMMAKNAVRDVARVLEVPYADADRLAKLVPDPVQGRHVPLKKAVVETADLKHEYETNPTSKEVVDYAEILEGTIRSHGVHACGVVIAPDDLVNYVPLEMAQKGVVATQFPMGQIEDLGLLKMDFLGLSNLTIINNALRIVKKVYKTKINLSDLPLDDKKAYELFKRGDTTGVFQFESAGMKRYLRELKPSAFDDIVAMVALYRPGPMQFIDSFIKRKYGKEEITYLHPGLENSLKDTYGILIYQEQFMQASKEWCGFTGGESDTLRKAVGKKKVDLMKKMKPQFVDGAVKVGGASREIAEEFWNQLVKFADYCFNKSHAACYALIAYWTAYIKANYPDAFMAALMTSDARDTDRLAIEIAECQRMGIEVLGPDINQSYAEFAVVGGENKIRFALAAVKNVGVGVVEEVLAERDKNGKFTSVCDFAKRVSATKFNKKAWESVIRAGGFDVFGDRSDLLFNLERIQAYGAKVQKDAASGQADLFSMLGGDTPAEVKVTEVAIEPAPAKVTQKEQLMWERELLGLYISSHPLDAYSVYLEEQTVPLSAVTPELDGRKIVVGGIISGVRSILTKSGTKMAFVQLEDKSGEIDLIIFPGLYEQVGGKLLQDVVLRVTGTVTAKDRNGNMESEAKVIADEVVVVTDEELANFKATGERAKIPEAVAKKPARKNFNGSFGGYRAGSNQSSARSSAEKPITMACEVAKDKRLFVHVKDADDREKLVELKKICSEHTGLEEIILVLGDGEEKKAMRMPFRVDADGELVTNLANVFGAECVFVKS